MQYLRSTQPRSCPGDKLYDLSQCVCRLNINIYSSLYRDTMRRFPATAIRPVQIRPDTLCGALGIPMGNIIMRPALEERTSSLLL